MHIKTGEVAMVSGIRRNPTQYYWRKKYDLMNVVGEDYLVLNKNNSEVHTIRVVSMEQYFDTLMQIHKESGHGGRDKMLYAIKNRLYSEKGNIPTESIVTKLIVGKDFNCSGQDDRIDFQSAVDRDYKWLLNYKDHATKFLQLCPLRSKQVSEVAQQGINIFLTFGAPYVLQSDIGRKFTAKIIEEVVKMWPECKIVHGSPRHSQTQGSEERCNLDIDNMLRVCMRDNSSTNWSFGCKFVQ